MPRYHAFISYSHEPDAKLARQLRLALHRFAKPWYKLRAAAVFLDQSSLSANPALWPAIENALLNSEYLLLLASRKSAESIWVRKEIDWWLRNRSAEKMLVLLTDGDLLWDRGAVDFDWGKTTAIARELSGRFADEPLYVDLRWTRTEPNLNLREPKFRSAILAVAAPLHGRSMDEIDGEDVQQNRRTMRLVRGAVALLILLTAAAVWQAVVATQQRREADTQRFEAQKQTRVAQENAAEARRQEGIAKEQRDEAVRQRDLALARSLSAEASRLSVNDVYWNLSMLLAIESMRSSPTASNYEILSRLSAEGIRPMARVSGGGATAFSSDSQWIASQSGEHIGVYQARGGKRLAWMPVSNDAVFRSLCFTPSGRRLVAQNADQITLFDLRKQIVIPLPDIPKGDVRVTSENCRYLADAAGRSTSVIDVEEGRIIRSLELEPPANLLAVSDDGGTLAFAAGAQGAFLDLKTGMEKGKFSSATAIQQLWFTENGQLAVLPAGKGLGVYDVRTGAQTRDEPARGTLTRDAEQQAEWSGKELALDDIRFSASTSKRIPLNDFGGMHWSRSGEFFSYSAAGDVRLLQAASWRSLARYTFVSSSYIGVGFEKPKAGIAAISPNEELAAATGFPWTTVFEIPRGIVAARLPPTAKPSPVALSRNGAVVAFVTYDGKLGLMDARSGKELGAVTCATPSQIQLSTDGRFLAAACAGNVVIYNVQVGHITGQLKSNFGSPAILSSDGSIVFAGGSAYWTTNGRKIRTLENGSAVAIDSVHRRIAIWSQNTGNKYVALYDLLSNRPPDRIERATDELMEGAAFSPDGALLAVSGRNMQAVLFDAQNRRQIRAFEHSETDNWVLRIRTLAFSPDGQFLVTMAEDPTVTDRGRRGTLRVFEVATGQEIVRTPFEELPHGFRFAPDNAYLEVLVGRRTIRWERYPIQAEMLIQRSCEMVHGNFSELDWRRYMGDAPYRNTCPSINPHAAWIK